MLDMFAYTDDVMAYVGYDWSDWNARVRAWYDGIGSRTPLYPPTPEGYRFSIPMGVEELAPPFTAVAERVAPIFLEGIPTWTAHVWESVAEDGSRLFTTVVGPSCCHQFPVSQFFDQAAWVLRWYGEGGALPRWLAQESEETIQRWYGERGRERFGFSVTFVPQGMLGDYRTAVARAAERQRQAETAEAEPKPPKPVRFTAMAHAPGELALSFHNATGARLGLVTAQTLGQPAWDFWGEVAQEDEEDGIGSAVVFLGEEGDAAPHFFRLVDLQTDSDGDRLPDLLERYVYKTDPLKWDSSGSGMSDWEKIFVHGLDTAVDDGDGDGLLDGEEVWLGTSPLRADTDGDGLLDGEEAAPIAVREGEAARWFESDTWTEHYPAGANSPLDSKTYAIVCKAFPIILGGAAYSELIIDVDGCVTLRDPSSNERIDAQGNNRALLGSWQYEKHPLIAGYWDDLAADVAHDSKIRHAIVVEDGDEYLVIDYRNLCPYSRRDASVADWRLSFQIAFRKAREGENVSSVFFNYKDVGGNVRGGSATIGIQNPARKQVWQYACNQDDAIDSAMSIVCVPGTQTDPLSKDGDGDGLTDKEEYFGSRYKTDPNRFDTDGDGLGDGEEILGVLLTGNHRCYLDPLQPDCDGDGLPDGWEVRHGLQPLNAVGDYGAEGDFDHDGLPNLQEYLFGTQPNIADTDEDGLLDGAIVGLAQKIPLKEPEAISLFGLAFAVGTNIDDSVARTTLPRPVTLAGRTYTSVVIDVNGVAHFLRASQAEDEIASECDNEPLDEWDEDRAYLSVALYWDDLKIVAAKPGNVQYGECIYEGKPCFLLSYMGLYTSHGDGSVYMRLIVPYDTDDTLIVQYPSLYAGFDCASATIGVRQPDAFLPIQFAYDTANALVSGEALRYTLRMQTDPCLADSDGDGLSDKEEVLSIKTDPLSKDGDGDGLTDKEEVRMYHTDPNVIDSDGDGMADGLEIRYGLPPLDNGSSNPSASPSGDWDGDGLANEQEVAQGLNPGNPDSDEDGLPDGDEVGRGINPLHPDSDGDHLIDGWESNYGFEPLMADGADVTEADPDSDGLSNWEESINGTSPYDADTDNDGVSDWQETEQGTDPTDPLDYEPLPDSELVQTAFSIAGDYAAWEMRIQGLGQGEGTLSDSRLLKHHMRTPGSQEESVFQLRKGCSYKVTMHWLETKAGEDEEWYCWSAQVNGQPSQQTYANYCPERKEDVATLVFGEGFWAENDDGLLCGHTHMRESEGGNVAGGLSAVVHIPDIASALVPDYQRDLMIDAQDMFLATNGLPFRLWINDDDDSVNKDYSEKDEDIPAATLFVDASNGSVDGVCDFLDFFPIHVDAQALLGFLGNREDIRAAYEAGDLTIKLCQADSAIKIVWTSLERGQSGAYLTENCAGCDDNLDKRLLDASTYTVTDDGLELPQKFVKLIRGNPNQGVILAEGIRRSSAPLTLGLYHDDLCVWKTELPLNVLPVEEMYGRIDLRSVESGSRTDATLAHNPSVPNVLFLHGFNVSEDAARGWHAEMYKRLYQSGLDMNFYGVTWRGDEALSELVGLPALHYHLNVYNAFKTAKAFAAAAKQLPQASQTSVLAHSLGNIVVSEAICSYGFKPDNYVFLNAAIPAEAFDASLQDATANQATLVPQDWRDYDPRTYASRWNELFSASEPQSQMRWAGLFEDIAQKSPTTKFYNFYSEEDEVFELRTDIEDGLFPPQYRGVLRWQFEGWPPWDLLASLVPETSFGRYAWQKQEFLKGTNVVFGTADGGWAFAEKWVSDASSGEEKVVPLYSAQEANAIVTNAANRLILRQAPVFSATAAMLSPDPDPEKQRDERYEILAYRIPALSPVMGRTGTLRNSLEGVMTMSPLNASTTNWGRRSGSLSGKWLHSDIKNMAFYYVWQEFIELSSFISQ